MTAVYPEVTYYLYYYNSSDELVQEDITKDVLFTQECSYGIEGTSWSDRVASTGQMELVLRNDAGCIGGINGYYSPYHVGSKEYWRTGLAIELVFTYGGADYTKFRGYIIDISPESGENSTRRVVVTLVDWMEYAANQPVYLPLLQENKRMDEVIESLVDAMPIAPRNTIYYPGTDTFSSVFDAITERTKVLGEFNKVAVSELGYVYLKRDKIYGETLVVEGRHKRTFESSLTKYSVPVELCGFLMLETGTSYLLQEDGYKIILDEAEEIIIDNTMMNLEVGYGKNVSNFVVVKAYPRRIDTVPVVLYSFSSYISLLAGETKTLVGRYRDPEQSAERITGTDMIAPLLGTDYGFWSGQDGSGDNLSAYLSINAYYGSDGVKYTLTNNAEVTGYVVNPLLQARGYGIYMYEPTESFQEDTTSQNTYGYKELTLDQKYQDNPYVSDAVAEVILLQDKDPRETAEKVYFNANTTSTLMTLFLHADIGDLIYIKENQTGIDGYYYIHAVHFTVQPGGIINFSWSLKEKLSLNVVYWLVEEVGYSELGITTILGY
jgi:hypothetical protein